MRERENGYPGLPPEHDRADGLSRQEQLVFECLQWTHVSPEPNVALDRLLTFVGQRFGCARAYIFEKNANGTYDNTHEWCAGGVSPQKEVLQAEGGDGLDWWLETFRTGREVVIRDMEDIRAAHPVTYVILRAQNIRSLAAAGLWDDHELRGFFGVDDPRPEELDRLPAFLRFINYFVMAILRRRDLMERLEHMSYHDQLTGVWNRNGFQERAGAWAREDRLGVAYCDITALKQINDLLGHGAGDEVIRRVSVTMGQVFGPERVYRMGGDEFLAVCPGMDRETFRRLTDRLKTRIADGEHPVAVGTAWTDRRPVDIDRLVAQADADMYESKRAYYSQIDPVTGQPRERRQNPRPADRRDRRGRGAPAGGLSGSPDSPLEQYLRANFFSGEGLLRSVGAAGHACFLFFGDMRTGVFYVADNLRDTFGFGGNVVPGFLSAWENRISNPEDLHLFRRDLRNMLAEKREEQDLWYRVRDKEGSSFWVHCRGRMMWNKERTRPVFFSGCFSSQEHDFVVDPTTNFPREYAALLKLSELKREGTLGPLVGFCLNHFSELNESRGREAADGLLRSVSARLNEHFGHQVYFYRLDGLRFLAVTTPDYRGTGPELAGTIQTIIRQLYREREVLLNRTCSLCVLAQPDPDGETTPQTILATVLSMLAQAKQAPDGEIVDSLSDRLRLQKRRAGWVLELNRSVLNGFSGFRVAVQPMVDAAGRVVGGELLLRWNCGGEDVPPDEWLPLLEKSRLILPVGRWVFEQTARICQRILPCRGDFRLSFNVSYHQLADEELPAFMGRTLERCGLDGSHLIMELTELHADETPERLSRFLDECRALGMQVALDDFGSGSSSLSLLLRYPADIVKLDRSLLAESARAPDKTKFIRSIVYACHQFGKQVCMEGVETDEELAIIRRAECDLVQGFLFYRPLELRQFYQLLLESENAPERGEG